MDKRELDLVEKVLGKDFLKAAQEYAASIRMACAVKGATQTIQEAIARVAEVAFVKGAECYRREQWHELKDKYPKLDTFVLCKGTAEKGHTLFLSKFVKDDKGGIQSVGADGMQTEKVSHWLEIPNIEER